MPFSFHSSASPLGVTHHLRPCRLLARLVVIRPSQDAMAISFALSRAKLDLVWNGADQAFSITSLRSVRVCPRPADFVGAVEGATEVKAFAGFLDALDRELPDFIG